MLLLHLHEALTLACYGVCALHVMAVSMNTARSMSLEGLCVIFQMALLHVRNEFIKAEFTVISIGSMLMEM